MLYCDACDAVAFAVTLSCCDEFAQDDAVALPGMLKYLRYRAVAVTLRRLP